MSPEWAIVLVTAIYCLLTLLIFWANHSSVITIKEQLKEMKRQFDESNRAFVTAHFELVRNGLMTICVGNQGTRVATDVRVKIKQIDINTTSGELRNNLEELCRAPFSLGIGQSWFFYLDTIEGFKQITGRSIDFEISYRDEFKSYNNTTSIEFNEHFGPLRYRSAMQDMLNEVREGVAALKKLPEAINRSKKE